MFERYTEKARRVIFFARYEASQCGSHYIDTEHLLLGLMREDRPLMSSMIGSGTSSETVRQEVEKRIQSGERFSTAAEVPLSVESKRVLNLAAEEAERLGERHVGTEHLLLGLLREDNALAAVILGQRGVHLAEIRLKLAGGASRYREPTKLVGSPRSYRVASKPARRAMDTLGSFLSCLKANTSPELADFSPRTVNSSMLPGKFGLARKKSGGRPKDCLRHSVREIRPIASTKPFLSAGRQCWYRSCGRTRSTQNKRRGRCCG